METYEKPSLEVINLALEQSLLYASGGYDTYSMDWDDDEDVDGSWR